MSHVDDFMRVVNDHGGPMDQLLLDLFDGLSEEGQELMLRLLREAVEAEQRG